MHGRYLSSYEHRVSINENRKEKMAGRLRRGLVSRLWRRGGDDAHLMMVKHMRSMVASLAF